MDSSIAVPTALLLFLSIYLLLSRRPPSYPPGPKPLPLIGNIFDLPQSQEWLTYAEWAKKWGNIFKLNALGRNIIVISDLKIASDLLEGQNTITANRPFVPMGAITGWDQTLIFKNAGDRIFKTERKMLHKIVGTPASTAVFDYIQEEEWRKALQRMMSDGKAGDVRAHVQAASSAAVLRIGYGYRIKGATDEYIALVKRVADAFSYGCQPNNFLVNIFPAIQRLPDWFPGTGYRKLARQWSREFNEFVDIPFNLVKDQMSKGIGERSMVMRLLEEPEDIEDWEDRTKFMMASMYSGGSDTSVAAIYAFYKAMILYPEVQRKAQAEVDRITGGLRLPTLKDRPNMPYLNALLSEVLRWHTIAPMGFPHVTSEEIQFNGYTIPKDAIIFINYWAITRNPASYPNPEKFDPERFLPGEGKVPRLDPKSFIFSFGRRICPGRYLALNNMFIAFAITLAVSNILPARDSDGKPIIPDTDTLSGVVCYPTPFDCEIKPRSKESVELIANY